MKRLLTVGALMVGIAAISVGAHHPFDAEFDWKKPVTITGTVTKFEWKNPHAVVEVQGKDDSGADARWTVELGALTDLTQAGWTSTALKSGEKVTVDGWRARKDAKRVNAKSVTPSGGHELFAASSFFDMGRPPALTSGARGPGRATGTSGTNPPAPKR